MLSRQKFDNIEHSTTRATNFTWIKISSKFVFSRRWKKGNVLFRERYSIFKASGWHKLHCFKIVLRLTVQLESQPRNYTRFVRRLCCFVAWFWHFRGSDHIWRWCWRLCTRVNLQRSMNRSSSRDSVSWLRFWHVVLRHLDQLRYRGRPMGKAFESWRHVVLVWMLLRQIIKLDFSSQNFKINLREHDG